MTPETQARLDAAIVELTEALDEAGEEGMPYLLQGLAAAAAASGQELPPILTMLL